MNNHKIVPDQTADLFSPMEIGGLLLRNRIIIPPMCQYSAPQGTPADWHAVHYGHLSLCGGGLLIVEATAVEKAGRISQNDLGLWDDAMTEPFARMLKSIRSVSAMPVAIQLGHAGRKASASIPWEGREPLSLANGGWPVIAPSALRYDPASPVPTPMSKADISRVIEAFAAAAARADQAGFEAVEIHMAHGYLLHQFLSPLSNQRGDEYGGSPANRMRFPLEVFRAVRGAMPMTKPVGVRISATDWVSGGWTVDDSITLAKELRHLGCAYIHVSGGGLSPDQKMRAVPGYQVGMAARIKNEAGLPTIAVGLITEAEQAQTIIETGQADMVAVGRAMLFNPRWPWHAARRLGRSIAAPKQYLRSAPANAKGLLV